MSKQAKTEIGKLIKHITNTLTPSIESVAKTIKAAPEMLQRVYNGLADGGNMTRAAIIQALYDEQKKKELEEFIKESVMKNLRIEKNDAFVDLKYNGYLVCSIDLQDYT